MGDENSIVLNEIRSLLAESSSARPASQLARVENTLTSGYAHALALEAERWRLERQLADLTERMGSGEAAPPTEEVASVARLIARADASLRLLRELLAELGERRRELRGLDAPLRRFRF